MTYSRIAGTGSYLPSNVVTNADLEKKLDTTDQWIQDRTGIKQRHIAVDGETTCDLAEQARDWTHLALDGRKRTSRRAPIRREFLCYAT